VGWTQLKLKMNIFEKTITAIYRILWLDWNNLATFLIATFFLHGVVPAIWVIVALKDWVGHPQFQKIGILYCQRWATLSFLFFVLPPIFLLIGYVCEKTITYIAERIWSFRRTESKKKETPKCTKKN